MAIFDSIFYDVLRNEDNRWSRFFIRILLSLVNLFQEDSMSQEMTQTQTNIGGIEGIRLEDIFIELSPTCNFRAG